MIYEQHSTDQVRHDRTLLLVFAVAAVLIFWNLGSLAQFTRAEIYFAEAAREMLVTGDWLTPRFCDRLFFDKPPLVYWMIAICFRMFGLSEAVARIPSAIAGIGTVGLVTIFAFRHYGRRAGLIAGLILTTSLGFWSFSRSAMSDALLTFFISAALFAYWEGVQPTANWKVFITLGHISLAFATLTKGPIGPGLSFLTIGATALLVRQLEWKRLLYPVAIVAFFAVAAPWYIAMYFQHGRTFLDYFFVGENISRFLGATYLKNRLPIYYAGVLITLFFPWSIWLPYSLKSLFKNETRSLNKFLLAWAVTTIAFFSLSRFKLDYYILPSYPALAILTGAGLARLFEFRERGMSLRGWLVILTAVLLTILGAVFLYNTFPILAIASIIAALLLFLTLKYEHQQKFPFVLAAGMSFLLFFLPQSASNTSAQTIHQLASVVSETRIKQVGAAFDLAIWYSDLRFYTGEAVNPLENTREVREFLDKPGPAVLLVPQEKLDSISQNTKNVKVLASGPYVGHGIWSRNLRQRKQQTVILVLVE